MFTFIRDLLASNSDRGMRDNGVRVLSNEDIQTVLQRLEEGVPLANIFEGYHLFFFTSFVPWLSSAFLLVPRDVDVDEDSEEDEEDADSGMGDNSSDNTESVANASDFDFDVEDAEMDTDDDDDFVK